MEAEKHVLLEIPMGLNLDTTARGRSGKAHGKGLHGLSHSASAAFFMRLKSALIGENSRPYTLCSNAFLSKKTKPLGKPRTWVDDLLWHQACHMVDMAHWLLGDLTAETWGQTGPMHPDLNIPSMGYNYRHAISAVHSLRPRNHSTITDPYKATIDS